MTEFYPTSGLPLTDEECRHSEQRILHDALLISQGAHINKLGNLCITETQYHTLKTGELLNVAVERWLGQTMEEALLGEPELEETPLVTRTVNALRRERLITRRDVLIAGKSKIFNVRNVGMRTLELLEPALANEFGIQWLDRPKAADIARFCSDLRQVNSIAIAEETICNIILDNYRYTIDALSVQDVLDRREEIGRVAAGLPEDRLKLAQLRREQVIAAHISLAETFAKEFHTAQQQIK